MKKLYTLLALLCLSGFFAEAQPIIKEDSTATNAICIDTMIQWYRFVTPVNGQLEIFTTAWVSDSTNPAGQRLGLEVLGRNHNIDFGTFFPRIGTNNVGALDTFYTTGGSAGLAVDTFYFRFDNSFAFPICFNYQISWHIIPATYPVSAQPDSFPGAPQLMPYSTNVTGNLGYNDGLREGEDGNNDWLIVPPMDGTLKVNMSVEALNGSYMSIQPYDSKFNGLVAQYPSAGAFHAPVDTAIYWDCISAGDTFYLETSLGTYGDNGYSYQMSYTIVPPVFSNDSEPNNSFAEAEIVNPKIPIEGHVSFYGESDDDYFKFYKPDTGFLRIYGQIESANTVSLNAFTYVTLYDSSQNDIKDFYPLIGGNSKPALDTMYVAFLTPGYYYLRASHSSSCLSYKFEITTPYIGPTAIRSIGTAQPLNIFPNPSSGAFTVDLGNVRNTTISVYNTMGQQVETMLQQNGRYVTLDKELPSGLYLIKASDSNGEVIEQGKLAITK
jgi:hypothetical protein